MPVEFLLQSGSCYFIKALNILLARGGARDGGYGVVIISASRRTDIPAFYSEWFLNRIAEGYACVRNPFNAGQISRVELAPGKVDAIVFWTRWPLPFLSRLDELDRAGYRYYFLFTLTGYPKALEPCGPPRGEALRAFRMLSEKIGPERVIWRFDPILISTLTLEEDIPKLFEGLARELRGSTGKVITSFCHYYGKVNRRLERLKREQGIKCEDLSPSPERKRGLAARLSEIAGCHDLEIATCAEGMDLSGAGIEKGRCVDDGLVNRLFGTRLSLPKDPHQRKECGCVLSRDIGAYNTCLHGCVYCYANTGHDAALRNFERHDPFNPLLLPE